MSEPRIGRVVVASVHQALSDHLPLRLDFYEDYLRPMRLREGRIGAASFLAALSFLRREDDAWEPVMRRAGRHAAEWEFTDLSRLRRALYRALPAGWRLRVLLKLARGLVARTSPATRGRTALVNGTGVIDIRHSPFCEVRDRAPQPLCGFYAAAFERLAELLELDGRVTAAGCQAMGRDHCRWEYLPAAPVPPARADTAPPP